MSEPKQNPKHIRAQKENKIPFEYLVLSVLEDDAWVHQGGGDKYGIRNWTIDEILASTYVGAMFRHLRAWAMGEDLDPESGKPHLTHLRACCAVVLDGNKHGKLIDDRLRAESKGGKPEKQFVVCATRSHLTADRFPLSKVEAHGPYNFDKANQVARNLRALTSDAISVSLIELKPPTEESP